MRSCTIPDLKHSLVYTATATSPQHISTIHNLGPSLSQHFTRDAQLSLHHISGINLHHQLHQDRHQTRPNTMDQLIFTSTATSSTVMSTPSTTPHPPKEKKPSPFFSLPPELCLQVYKQYISSHHFTLVNLTPPLPSQCLHPDTLLAAQPIYAGLYETTRTDLRAAQVRRTRQSSLPQATTQAEKATLHAKAHAQLAAAKELKRMLGATRKQLLEDGVLVREWE